MDTLHKVDTLHMEGILHMEDILYTKNQDAEVTRTTTVTIAMRAMVVIDMVLLGYDTATDQEDVVGGIPWNVFASNIESAPPLPLYRQSSCLSIRSLWLFLSAYNQRVLSKNHGANEEILGTQAYPINLGRME